MRCGRSTFQTAINLGGWLLRVKRGGGGMCRLAPQGTLAVRLCVFLITAPESHCCVIECTLG